jgi:hypothetical protein
VRKRGALVQSSQVYEMHTKRLMAFEKRGQNDITQPLLPLYSCAISRQIPLAKGKVNSSNMPPPRAIISSLSNFALPLSFPITPPDHQAALPPTYPPPPESPPLHSCTRYATLQSSSPSSAPRDNPPLDSGSSPHQFYAPILTRSSCRNSSPAGHCEM